MDDAVRVRVRERLGHLAGDGERFRRRDRSVREPLGERRPFDELQHQRASALELLLAVEHGDVRVMAGGHELRLALEAGPALGVVAERLPHQLEGDFPPQLGVAGAPDLAHPARAELGGDLVGAEARSGHEDHRANAPSPSCALPARKSIGRGVRLADHQPFHNGPSPKSQSRYSSSVQCASRGRIGACAPTLAITWPSLLSGFESSTQIA